MAASPRVLEHARRRRRARGAAARTAGGAEARWVEDGEGDYRLAGHDSLADLCRGLAEGCEIRTQWPVGLVESSDGRGLRLSTPDGRALLVDAAVIAVPVLVLQRQQLRFDPPLPPPKRAAIGSIRMMGALKLVVQLARKPYGEDGAGLLAEGRPLHSMLCAGCAVPELWIKRGRRGSWLVSGFATGSYASALAALPREAAVDVSCGSSRSSSPATRGWTLLRARRPTRRRSTQPPSLLCVSRPRSLSLGSCRHHLRYGAGGRRHRHSSTGRRSHTSRRLLRAVGGRAGRRGGRIARVEAGGPSRLRAGDGGRDDDDELRARQRVAGGADC